MPAYSALLPPDRDCVRMAPGDIWLRAESAESVTGGELMRKSMPNQLN